MVGLEAMEGQERLISKLVNSEVFQVSWGKQPAILPSTCDVFHQIKGVRQRLTASSGVRLNVLFPSSHGNVLCSHTGRGGRGVKGLISSAVHLNHSQISCNSQASIQPLGLAQMGSQCVSAAAQKPARRKEPAGPTAARCRESSLWRRSCRCLGYQGGGLGEGKKSTPWAWTSQLSPIQMLAVPVH